MNLEGLRKSAKELFGTSKDENTIVKFSEFEGEIDKIGKEQEELLKRNTALQDALKKAVLNKDYGKSEVKEETTNKPKSLKDYMASYDWDALKGEKK